MKTEVLHSWQMWLCRFCVAPHLPFLVSRRLKCLNERFNDSQSKLSRLSILGQVRRNVQETCWRLWRRFFFASLYD